MKKFIALIWLTLLTNCSSNSKDDLNDNFKEVYQREICDKYDVHLILDEFHQISPNFR